MVEHLPKVGRHEQELLGAALAELVAELIALKQQALEASDKDAAGQPAQFVITGDRPTINFSPQPATIGGTNVTVGTTASGSVTVSGSHGIEVGSQSVSGKNSNVLGRQAVQGDHSAIAGRDTTNIDAKEQPAKEGWWTRLRKRGMVVAVATIIGGIAAVVGTAVALCAWIGWMPWS
jgi:hypothetical protein